MQPIRTLTLAAAAITAGLTVVSTTPAHASVTLDAAGVSASALASPPGVPGDEVFDGGTTGAFTASASHGDNNFGNPPTFSQQDGAFASAEADLTVATTTAGGFTATGEGEAFARSRPAQFQSNDAVGNGSAGLEFEVTSVNAVYSLSGSMAGMSSSTLFGEGGSYNVTVTLSDALFNEIENISIDGNPNDVTAATPFSESGTLTPGIYTLSVFIVAGTQTTSSNAPSPASAEASIDSFAFTVNPIPEPGTLALLGIYGVSLLCLRRRVL